MTGGGKTASSAWQRALGLVVRALGVLAGAGVLGMMLVTCADIVARTLGHPLKGSYDAVCLLSLVTLSCALPYTTAVKGHVAVEYFFNKLPLPAQLVIDALMRLLVIALLGLIAYQAVLHGMRLRASGEVMPTTQWPVFWAAYVVAASCALSALVVVQHLLHPRKGFLAP